ncbi:hypothetical protein AZI85_13580 [Bdellovibrio bacteriovorus]|uniref:Phage tail collar domain-containing protein n=1 Tax=Bdellovibrio bacteriovorus TaxID=959 RepID=A0A150WBY6_BDEBC|nr:phage tail protein [Bdellovibrio bacteriovorus]KYG60487.1 hypothetical protein AZI85_13580 [Bdellovibrio bacteriovorus]
MNKKLLIMLLFAVPALGFKYKEDLTAMGLKFVAPTIMDRNSVFQPEEGEIIYEAAGNDRRFYGKTDVGWVPLSAGESILPPGIILPYGGESEPPGFYFADGRALPIAGNEALYDAIKEAFGNGTRNADGTLSSYAAGDAFNLPDLRGRFLRGVNGSATELPSLTAPRDPAINDRVASNVGGFEDNRVGSVQTDALQNITGGFGVDRSAGSLDGAFFQGNNPIAGGNTAQLSGASTTSALRFDASRVARTSSETRPKNVYVNYIIKR